MSRSKKVLLAAAGVFGALLVALVVLPFFFIDSVEARVRAEIERATRVRVDWSEARLGFLRDFPNPSLSLRDLTVVGTDRFEGDTLAAIGDFRISLAGPSLIRAARGGGPLVVRSVRLVDPVLRLEADEDGTASWDVVRESTDEGTADGATRALTVSLQRLVVSGGDVLLDDRSTGTFLSARAIDHSLRGDFSRASLVAETRTQAEDVTARIAGAPYLNGVMLALDADVDVDLEAGRIRLAENELRLNDLVVRFAGTVARAGDDLDFDLTFDAPGTSFDQVLSLASVVYANDFASFETTGTFSLAGNVRGMYGPGSFPAFGLDLEVMDGGFSHPGVPQRARAIAMSLSVANPGGSLDSTVVDLSRFHFELGQEVFDASFTLRTPLSDPAIDARVDGTIDLGDAARLARLENAGDVGGTLVADATVRARRSDVDAARWERVDAAGTISARDVTLRGEQLRQPVDVQTATLTLSPSSAQLQSFEARLGTSDLRAEGRLDNLLGFALSEQPLTGRATFASNRFNLDEWKSEDEVAAIPVPSRVDFTLDGTVDRLVLNGLEMTGARGRGIVRDQRLTLEGFTLGVLGGRVGVDGYYETLPEAAPAFALDLILDSLDVAGASEAFLTVRTLAPIARYARGTFSTDLRLTGTLGENLAPDFSALEGNGSMSTSQVAIEGFPMFDRLAETLQLQRFSNPTVDAVRSGIRIEGGRLFIAPLQTQVAGLPMSVTGSNGIDQTIDYTLGLQVPRAGFADAALTSLASRAGPLGTRLAAIDPVPVRVRVTGLVTSPTLDLGLSEAPVSLGNAAQRAGEAAVGQRIEDAQARLDASREEARLRAQAQADSIVSAARRQADGIRAEGARAAAEVRAQGERAATELLARASNPVARAAAQPAAERLRREADERATTIEQEADARATALVAEAEARAAALTGG